MGVSQNTLNDLSIINNLKALSNQQNTGNLGQHLLNL